MDLHASVSELLDGIVDSVEEQGNSTKQVDKPMLIHGPGKIPETLQLADRPVRMGGHHFQHLLGLVH
jgi:hypothetical protein